MLTFWKKTRWTGLSRFIAFDAAFGLVIAAVIANVGLAILAIVAGIASIFMRKRVTPDQGSSFSCRTKMFRATMPV